MSLPAVGATHINDKRVREATGTSSLAIYTREMRISARRIYLHKLEKSKRSYILPYSWNIRLAMNLAACKSYLHKRPKGKGSSPPHP